MYLKKAKIKNFKTIKNSIIEFTNEPTLILGENLDESGCDGNSAGKSNFIDSLLWSLYGSKFIDSPVKNLIRWGEKSMSVELEFSDPEVKISRSRSSDLSSDNLSVVLDGKKVVGTTTSEIEQAFMDKMNIDLPLKDFVYNTLLIKEGKSFFTLSSSEQERVIKDLLKLSVLHNYYEKSNKKKSDIDESIKMNDVRLENSSNLQEEADEKEIEKEIDFISLEIDKLPSEELVQKEIDKLDVLISKVQSEIIGTNVEIGLKDDELSNLNKNVIETEERFFLEESNIKDIESKIIGLGTPSDKDQWIPKMDFIKEKIEGIKKEKYTLQSEKLSKERELQSKNETFKSGKGQKCPECNSNLIFSGGGLIKFDVETVREEIKNLTLSIENIVLKIKECDTKITEGNTFLDEVYQRQQDINQSEMLKKQLEGGKEFIKSYKRTKDTLTQQIYLLEQIASKLKLDQKDRHSQTEKLKKLKQNQLNILNGGDFLKKKNYIKRLEEVKEKLTDVKATNLVIRRSKEERKEITKANKKLSADLDKFDIIGKLAIKYEKKAMNDFLPKLSSLINLYLSRLEVEERITIQAGEDKSRKKKDKFNFNFFNGIVEGDSSITSCGKRERIQIAQILGLSEILNSQLKYPFKFMIGDEIISNIDNTGVQFIINLFQSLGIQLLLVLQRSEQISNCRNIIIRKENGISEIK